MSAVRTSFTTFEWPKSASLTSQGSLLVSQMCDEMRPGGAVRQRGGCWQALDRRVQIPCGSDMASGTAHLEVPQQERSVPLAMENGDDQGD